MFWKNVISSSLPLPPLGFLVVATLATVLSQTRRERNDRNLSPPFGQVTSRSGRQPSLLLARPGLASDMAHPPPSSHRLFLFPLLFFGFFPNFSPSESQPQPPMHDDLFPSFGQTGPPALYASLLFLLPPRNDPALRFSHSYGRFCFLANPRFSDNPDRVGVSPPVQEKTSSNFQVHCRGVF